MYIKAHMIAPAITAIARLSPSLLPVRGSWLTVGAVRITGSATVGTSTIPPALPRYCVIDGPVGAAVLVSHLGAAKVSCQYAMGVP